MQLKWIKISTTIEFDRSTTRNQSILHFTTTLKVIRFNSIQFNSIPIIALERNEILILSPFNSFIHSFIQLQVIWPREGRSTARNWNATASTPVTTSPPPSTPSAAEWAPSKPPVSTASPPELSTTRLIQSKSP